MSVKKEGTIEAKGMLINISWMVFDKVFLLVLNLLVIVKIANYYGATEYGSYQYALSIVAILEILITFVDARVVKKKYNDFDPAKVVFNATVCRILFSGFSAGIGLIFLFFFNGGKTFSTIFTILLVNTVVINMRFGMANRFEYLLKSKKTVIAADSAALLSAILQLVAVKLEWTIIAVSIIATVSSCVNLMILYIQYRIEFDGFSFFLLDTKVIKSMVVESLPLAIAASCATIYQRTDSVMLGVMLTTTEVGIFSIALKLISVVQIPLIPIRESVFPKLIQLYYRDKSAYSRKYIQITSLLTWLFILGAAFSYMLLPFVFRFLNTEYAEAYPIYKIYLLGTFFTYNAGLRAGHFTIINRGNILMYTQFVSVIFNIVLNYIMIKLWGLYGAAAATAITQCISLFISNIFFGKEGKEVFYWQLKAMNPLRALKG